MRDQLAASCNILEECYEFMLAYAAQGLSGDESNQSGGQLRELLGRAASSLPALAEIFAALVKQEDLQPTGPYHRFIAVLDRDADDALAAIELVLAQPTLSSQLVDNLNASIHLRALLTDLFLMDEVVKLRQIPAKSTMKT